MKKKIYIIIMFISAMSILFSGCQLISYNETKPNIYYYTNKVRTIVNSTDSIKVELFQSDLYKTVDVTDEGIDVIKNCLKDLTDESFLKSSPQDLPDIPPYKLIISCGKEKFIINIFNENTISVYNWDGIFKEDFVSIKNVHRAYNLYGFCRYVFTIQ